jgi:hypothetical protein
MKSLFSCRSDGLSELELPSAWPWCEKILLRCPLMDTIPGRRALSHWRALWSQMVRRLLEQPRGTSHWLRCVCRAWMVVATIGTAILGALFILMLVPFAFWTTGETKGRNMTRVLDIMWSLDPPSLPCNTAQGDTEKATVFLTTRLETAQDSDPECWI